MRSLRVIFWMLVIWLLLLFWPVSISIVRLELQPFLTDPDYLLLYFLPIGIGAVGLIAMHLKRKA